MEWLLNCIPFFFNVYDEYDVLLLVKFMTDVDILIYILVYDMLVSKYNNMIL